VQYSRSQFCYKNAVLNFSLVLRAFNHPSYATCIAEKIQFSEDKNDFCVLLFYIVWYFSLLVNNFIMLDIDQKILEIISKEAHIL